MNFVPTFENGRHGDFPSFWKFGSSGLVDHFVVRAKTFLEVMGPYKNVNQEYFLDSKLFIGFYYRAWTIWFSGFFRRYRRLRFNGIKCVENILVYEGKFHSSSSNEILWGISIRELYWITSSHNKLFKCTCELPLTTETRVKFISSWPIFFYFSTF